MSGARLPAAADDDDVHYFADCLIVRSTIVLFNSVDGFVVSGA